MATHKLLLLPGDGIGPEVMGEVKKLIKFFNDKGPARFETEEGLVGGAAYDAHKVSISEADMDKAKSADAVIFGAVGGPKWDGVPYEVRPEAGLLRLRKDLALYANLRPAVTYPALADASSLKRELVEGLDIMILRELTGGVYFGEPKTITDLGNGQKRAIDTQVYDTYEIERIAAAAFELARTRRNKVTSMEKRNVMKSGVLWREEVQKLRDEQKPVYIDFTARWCATCQTNKLVYKNEALQEDFKKRGVVQLKADWTNYDERITAALKALDRAAVPVNVLYVPGRDEPLILPNILTVSNVTAALAELDKTEKKTESSVTQVPSS